MDNRPRGRQKNVTGAGKGIHKRGEGLNTGPVGRQDGYAGRTGSTGSVGGQQTGRPVRTTRKGSFSLIAIIAALVLGGGGLGLNGLLGGGTDSLSYSDYETPSSSYSASSSGASLSSSTSGSSASSASAGSDAYDVSSLLGSLLGGGSGSSSSYYTPSAGTTSTGWSGSSNAGTLDSTVASGSRAKRTQIMGNGEDVFTIMVYMCGTDLESKNKMATSDLMEMTKATIGDNVNLLVYTGGCKRWQNNVVSSSVNQIYKVESGGLRCLVKDDGSAAMTKPATLTSFINYCTKNYPANRNVLIFWDHGGGSLSGYGYDEKYPASGSMSLRGINEALKGAGTTFDFIGFDACLMATLETGLMLDNYADYLIASEETEPGVGWYYTNWLTALSKNTSMPTIEIGRNIVDDFVAVCNQTCNGQKTTLSVVDLAELANTVPDKLSAFAAGTSAMLQGNQFQEVSDARSSTREFATSSRIDQVDLVHLARNLGTDEGADLAKALLGAVKYNKTSSNMTNAYGISIYFPYQKTSSVSNAVATYEAIGMDSNYTRCIQQFASMETGGQAVAGGASSPLSSLLGGGYSGGFSSSSDISGILSGLLGGGGEGFFGRSLDMDSAVEYLTDNQFDAGQLVWTPYGDSYSMVLAPEQWALVHDLQLNVFYDDGEGYIDLGLDNIFEFTEDGDLLGEYDGTWLAIDQQPVAYYYTDSVFDGDNYTITGRVPVLLNGDRANLILVFDNAHPYGYIAGARMDYVNGETETIAKGVTELTEGDVIEFVCDYYGYDGSYQNSYLIGDPLTYTGNHEISNVYIDADNAQATYLFTDIYNQEYWTPAIP